MMPNSTSPPKTPLEQPGVPPSVAARLEAAATFSSVVSATPSILLHAATLRRVEDQPPPDFHRAIGDPAAEVHLAPGKGASPRLSPRVPLPGEDGAFDADAEFELLTTPAINAPVLADRRLSVQGSTAGFLLDEAATPAGHRPPTPVFRPSSPPIAPTPSGTGNDLLIPPPRPATPISSWLEPHVSPLVAPSPLSAPPVVPAARFATPGDDYVPYDLDHHVEGDNATWHEHEPEPVPITSETSAVPDVASVGHDLTSKGKMSGDAGIGAERTRRYLVKKKPMARDALASIFHTRHPPSASDYCMRMIEKTVLQKNSVGATPETVRKSSELWADLDHPQIIKLFDWWESDIEFVQILTLTAGGRLVDRIKKYGHFPERDAAIIMATLVNTASYLHGLHILHRDIRADNVLYKDADPESIMYLGYLDLAVKVPEGGVKGAVGAVANAAPEVLKRKAYSFPVDCWALGIVAYQLLSGEHPFVTGRGTLGETFDHILGAEPNFEGPVWAMVSPEGKEFVRRLLDKNAETRMSAADALDHEWLQLYAPRTYLEWLKSITTRHALGGDMELLPHPGHGDRIGAIHS